MRCGEATHIFLYFGKSISIWRKWTMEQQLVDSKIKENVEMMNRLLPVKESFDIVERNMLIGGRKSCLYFINGFTNDESEQKIIDFF